MLSHAFEKFIIGIIILNIFVVMSERAGTAECSQTPHTHFIVGRDTYRCLSQTWCISEFSEFIRDFIHVHVVYCKVFGTV